MSDVCGTTDFDVTENSQDGTKNQTVCEQTDPAGEVCSVSQTVHSQSNISGCTKTKVQPNLKYESSAKEKYNLVGEDLSVADLTTKAFAELTAQSLSPSIPSLAVQRTVL